MNFKIQFALVMAICLGCLSCTKDSMEPLLMAGSETATPAASSEQSKQAGGLASEKDTKQTKTPADMPRKLIRNGEIRLVVKTYPPARQAIEALVHKSGGYISDSRMDHSLGHVSSATLTVRFPSTRFSSILEQIARLGTVVSESTSTKDITEAYYDIKARLSNAKKLEGRLLDLLAKQTGKVSDLLQVERELARVREKIESFEGKLRLYNNQVDLSTLVIHLTIQQKYVPPVAPSLLEDIKEVVRDSWDALKSLGRGLVLALFALAPWSIPLALVIGLLIRWRRRRKARKGS